MDELAEIFADMGFAVATGPEIEDDWHNFTALNMPESHPARAMHDTFYFPDKDAEGRSMLLRTHTSPVQIRTMLPEGAPIRIIAPGRVYRSDSDATHTPDVPPGRRAGDRQGHSPRPPQVDAGDLPQGLLRARGHRPAAAPELLPLHRAFGRGRCRLCGALVKGKRVLGGSGDAPGHGWMELLGSGMVNRKVIAAGGLDPDEWQGFAFGTGVDRLAMLKYGMDDLRAFFDGDVRWLRTMASRRSTCRPFRRRGSTAHEVLADLAEGPPRHRSDGCRSRSRPSSTPSGLRSKGSKIRPRS
jgi:phenylalanyl-tRNA synthetase alpha chain